MVRCPAFDGWEWTLQLGFVIDHSRCIGCHACTVACKAENDVPVGSFRTWVKYTETGEFPEVRRSFAVLRCNQCTNPPCVSICPVQALDKRDDGIVDIDPARCIGCKSCLQACPYDALYVNDQTGVAEKCHFCAHRTERGLAPACAVVCPTEAIIPGDFDDPASRVSQMQAAGGLAARKTEAGTGPNVRYRDVAPAGIEPLTTNSAGGFLWANQFQDSRLEAQQFEASEGTAAARTVYDVAHPAAWGSKVSAYLLTKSLAAGVLLAGLTLSSPISGGGGLSSGAATVIGLLALVFLGITSVLLIADLKRPDRFWFILRYPNWGSWLVRGTVFLIAYGAVASLWTLLYFLDRPPAGASAWLLTGAVAVAALGTAVYTAWLFGQAHGRVLWMRRGLAIGLGAHALTCGAALLIALSPLLQLAAASVLVLKSLLGGSLLLQALLVVTEGRMAPTGRAAEYGRAMALLTRGPYAGRHRAAIVLGLVVPLLLLVLPSTAAWIAASLLALVGVFLEQDNFVRAGQALPIS